jgi:hypothetical protein
MKGVPIMKSFKTFIKDSYNDTSTRIKRGERIQIMKENKQFVAEAIDNQRFGFVKVRDENGKIHVIETKYIYEDDSN